MSQDTVHIKPARPGLMVRDPDTYEPLPKAGAKKPRSAYWTRRLLDGDVIRAGKSNGSKS